MRTDRFGRPLCVEYVGAKGLPQIRNRSEISLPHVATATAIHVFREINLCTVISADKHLQRKLLRYQVTVANQLELVAADAITRGLEIALTCYLRSSVDELRVRSN